MLEQLAQHLESNPNDVEGWRLLAASYMQLGRYDEGRAAYQRAVGADAASPTTSSSSRTPSRRS